jgi:hypothetical protein
MSKHKHPKSRTAHTAPVSRHGWQRRTLLAAGVVGALGGGYLLLAPGAGGRGRSFQVQGGERKPVLDPLQFPTARVRQAYAAAARRPEVLDQVYCYCKCDQPPFFHKSLLSCFTDNHGAG